MTEAAGGRPQDQGRTHRRRGRPSAETSSLLADYQAAMRDELRDVLGELRGKPPAAGLLDDPANPPAPVRPPLTERARLWDLAIKVGRELGTEVDVTPAAGEAGPAQPAGPRKWRRGRVDFGPDR